MSNVESATSLSPAAPDVVAEKFIAERRAHWDAVAANSPPDSRLRRHYHNFLAHTYRFLIPSGATVLELGCGAGDLLAAIAPNSDSTFAGGGGAIGWS